MHNHLFQHYIRKSIEELKIADDYFEQTFDENVPSQMDWSLLSEAKDKILNVMHTLDALRDILDAYDRIE